MLGALELELPIPCPSTIYQLPDDPLSTPTSPVTDHVWWAHTIVTVPKSFFSMVSGQSVHSRIDIHPNPMLRRMPERNNEAGSESGILA
jgi:hypothetical protein